MNVERKSNAEKLGRGMIIVLIANVVSMLFNFLINFLQPKYLSVDTYASIKTFVLYLSVIGVFHFGYADGTYLRYGGKDKEEIDKRSLGKNISTMRIFQLTASVVLLAAGLLMRNEMVIISAIMLLPYNMTMHFRMFYQAVGDFKLYGRVMNWSAAMIFLGNVLLIFLFHLDHYTFYLALQIIVYLIIWFILELNIRSALGVKAGFFLFSLSELYNNVKTGFLIMVGNFSSIFLTTLDRWFVKYLLLSVDFAQYSFAVSLEGFLNVAISPFTITLYNYFCNEKRNEKIREVHNWILILAVSIVAIAFPLKYIVEHWLPNYIGAMKALFILFASQILFIVIKSIYVNLYKARHQQNRYFTKLVIVLVSGAVFNGVSFFFWRAKEAMSLGTLLSAVLWFVLCQFDFLEICYDVRHCAYLMLELAFFLLFGLSLTALQGFLLYAAVTVILGALLLHKDFAALYGYVKRMAFQK